FFFSSRRRHTRSKRDWSSDVCSSDLNWYNLNRIRRDTSALSPYIDTFDPPYYNFHNPEADQETLERSEAIVLREIPPQKQSRQRHSRPLVRDTIPEARHLQFYELPANSWDFLP